MRWRGRAPQATEQSRDDTVLLRLGSRLNSRFDETMARTRLAQLEIPPDSRTANLSGGSASISCSPSMCGIASFKTAGVPSRRVTGATHARLPSSLSKGGPTFSDHRCSSARTFSASRARHSARSACAIVSPSVRRSLVFGLLGLRAGGC